MLKVTFLQFCLTYRVSEVKLATIHAHTHVLGQSRVTYQPNWCVFGMWEKTGILGNTSTHEQCDHACSTQKPSTDQKVKPAIFLLWAIQRCYPNLYEFYCIKS